MAITKMMYINKSASGASHLKNSIDYIMNEKKVQSHMENTMQYYNDPAKTDMQKYVGSYNCNIDTAYEEMQETKRDFGKEDGRQAYHFVISFKPGDVTENVAFDILKNFCREYLGDRYENVFALHTDKEHIHGHIIFNSINFIDGKKYRYEDGDWEKFIQPIVDRLCEERNVPRLEYHIDEYKDREGNKKEKVTYSSRYNWNSQIRKDIDESIDESKDFNEFIENMKKRTYRINHLEHGKYITVKLPQMKKARRLKGKSIGENYSEEMIRLRLAIKNGEFKSPDINNIHRISSVKWKNPRMKYKKWKDMNLYERERCKIVFIRHGSLIRLSRKQRPWQKNMKTAEFNKTLENLQYTYSRGFQSEDQILNKIMELKSSTSAEYKKISELKSYLKIANVLLDKIKANELNAKDEMQLKVVIGENVTIDGVVEYICALETKINQESQNIKNIRYEIARCMRLLKDNTKNLLQEYSELRSEGRKMEEHLRNEYDIKFKHEKNNKYGDKKKN